MGLSETSGKVSEIIPLINCPNSIKTKLEWTVRCPSCKEETQSWNGVLILKFEEIRLETQPIVLQNDPTDSLSHKKPIGARHDMNEHIKKNVMT